MTPLRLSHGTPLSLQALVPQTDLAFPVHFGLCELRGDSTGVYSRARVARLQLGEEQWRDGRMVPAPSGGYHYAVIVCMTLPESPPNDAAGMFDVTLELLGGGGASELEPATRPLLHSSRPMVLQYKSPLLRWFWTCFYAMPLLLGFMQEKQDRCAEMHAHFFNPRSGAAVARVSISECGVQVYEATLQFRLHFDTLGYVMHTWYFSSAVVGIGALMLVQLAAVLAFAMRHVLQTEPTVGGAGADAAQSQEAAPSGDPLFTFNQDAYVERAATGVEDALAPSDDDGAAASDNARHVDVVTPAAADAAFEHGTCELSSCRRRVPAEAEAA